MNMTAPITKRRSIVLIRAIWLRLMKLRNGRNSAFLNFARRRSRDRVKRFYLMMILQKKPRNRKGVPTAALPKLECIARDAHR